MFQLANTQEEVYIRISVLVVYLIKPGVGGLHIPGIRRCQVRERDK